MLLVWLLFDGHLAYRLLVYEFGGSSSHICLSIVLQGHGMETSCFNWNQLDGVYWSSD